MKILNAHQHKRRSRPCRYRRRKFGLQGIVAHNVNLYRDVVRIGFIVVVDDFTQHISV